MITNVNMLNTNKISFGSNNSLTVEKAMKTIQSWTNSLNSGVFNVEDNSALVGPPSWIVTIGRKSFDIVNSYYPPSGPVISSLENRYNDESLTWSRDYTGGKSSATYTDADGNSIELPDNEVIKVRDFFKASGLDSVG